MFLAATACGRILGAFHARRWNKKPLLCRTGLGKDWGPLPGWTSSALTGTHLLAASVGVLLGGVFGRVSIHPQHFSA